MSFYSDVTEQDLIKFVVLAEQQKNQQATKDENRISERNHDKESAENFEPITKTLTEVKRSTKNLEKG